MNGGSSDGLLKRERVREHLLGLIEGRRPGDPVPSERTLCAELEVSRPTLRAAVDELVATGLLVREHGRGTFVAPAKITQRLAPDDAAFTVPRASGTWSGTVLETTVRPAGARIGRKLEMSPAAGLLCITRLRLVDGAPMAIEHLHIPAGLVPAPLATAELEAGELYDHLRDNHGVRVEEAVQSVEPTVVGEAEAALLRVPVLSPALLIERLTRDSSGRPVEYVHSVYRGDRYRIVSRLDFTHDGSPAPAPGAAGRDPGPRGNAY
ncbi:GntR family transcriptional regulator [Streptomyces genisteinicus]|uniref:GntR family transcriptional regulator n=1 Tax=Streptomyces genisteinicus TaxID=2768068 RepID=A0A7H0I2N8_9ACTN|nr:GntR family transcriptional regulator [Streptomyces genisteinicus]QNP67054.1 GntR family transcriptional regulator [Streptomyces genisteinicus]